MSEAQPPPQVLALVLADAVLRDMGTGKFFIQGTYSALAASGFPWTLPVMAVYAAFTNGHGQTAIKIRLVDADEERPPLVEAESVLTFPDPIQVAEAVLAVPNVVFPEPGEYRLQLFGAGQPLLERRLQVVARPPAQPA